MIRVLLSAPLCLHIWLPSRFTCWPEIGIVPHETVLVEHYGRRQEWPRDVLPLLAEEFRTAGHVVSGALASGDRPPRQEDSQHRAEYVAQLHEARQQLRSCIPYGQYSHWLSHSRLCLYHCQRFGLSSAPLSPGLRVHRDGKG